MCSKIQKVHVLGSNYKMKVEEHVVGFRKYMTLCKFQVANLLFLIKTVMKKCCHLQNILRGFALGGARAQGGGGGVLPEKLDIGVWPASQNPYPIYDQNLRFSLPYL